MPVDVAAELWRLAQMRVPDLKARYAEASGEETRSNNRDYLIKRIVWRLQAREEGDLSERAHRRAEELADDADLRTRAPTTTRRDGRRSLIAPLNAASSPPFRC